MSVLSVRNLRISFKTNNGTVKAVRDISFDVNKGETIAIVGESGSGKSVTARAIMGILAGNSIVEGGEIFYDGMDLMKIEEEDFHKLRGNRISMIFQDPLSSLNPIVKIGKQLDEAMLLNGSANQKEARREFDTKLKLLLDYTSKAYTAENNASAATAFAKKVNDFRKYSDIGTKKESVYNEARSYATGALSDIEGLLIELIAGQPKDVVKKINYTLNAVQKAKNQYLTVDVDRFDAVLYDAKTAKDRYLNGDKTAMESALKNLQTYLTEILDAEKTDFFALGYYLMNGGIEADLPAHVSEKNRLLNEQMTSAFTNDFLADMEKGVSFSAAEAAAARLTALDALRSAHVMLSNGEIDIAKLKVLAKELGVAVSAGIDKLAIVKEGVSYTFASSLENAVEIYEKAIISARSNPEADVELPRRNILDMITRMIETYENAPTEFNAAAAAASLLNYLESRASAKVYRITKQMAKARSIKLMQEVGIPEPHKRYYQYPFQFSGGMRQRIVIAIALAANPDILICDEPTTALDVTIQAQILDLINGLKKERQLTVIFITHDLGVVANMADKIAVMYAGKIVEYGTVNDVFYDPRHPYTWALLASMPDLDTKEKLEAIPGTPPNMILPPKGDAFAARNKYALQIDFEQQPPMFEVSPTHYAATWLLHPDAPHVDPPKIVTDRIERMKKYGGAES